MPWKPFKKKVKHRRLQEDEEETSFDLDLQPRSTSDGNLARAPSERFLLQNLDHRRSYGTCSSGSSHWSSFRDHVVLEGETLAGLSLKYNITIQDIKLANKIWTNDGIWPGRTLRIPVTEAPCTSLDLSCPSTSETMSTDSRVSESLVQIDSSSSSSSRRASSSQDCPNSNRSFTSSPISLPLPRSIRENQSQDNVRLPLPLPVSCAPTHPCLPSRGSVEDLSSFLSAMDSRIEMNKAASISIIKKSVNQGDGRCSSIRHQEVDFSTNNNGTISGATARGGRAQDHAC